MLKLSQAELRGAIRRVLASKMMLIHDCYHNRNGKSLRCIHNLFPVFTVELPSGMKGDDIRYLFPLNTRQHSKKRVYTDMTVTVEPNNIFLSYLSREGLSKLLLRKGAFTNPFIENTLDRMGDRWWITIQRPVDKFTEFIKLRHCLVALSPKTDANHPPIGTYEIGPDIDWMLRADPISRSKIVCTVSKTVDNLD